MFYLINFFKIFTLSPVKSVSFYFSTIFLILIALFVPEINKYVDHFYTNLDSPYFIAVIENADNSQTVISQLHNIPGVEKIKIESAEEMRERFTTIVNDLELDSKLASTVFGSNPMGLKIFLSSGNSKSKNEDIRGQVQSLLELSKTNLSPIKNSGLVQNPFLIIVKNWAAQLILLFFSVVWLISLFNLIDVIRSKAYLIEQFTRKKKVAFKIILSGLTFFLALFAIPKIILMSPHVYELCFVIILFSFSSMLFLRKWSWRQ